MRQPHFIKNRLFKRFGDNNNVEVSEHYPLVEDIDCDEYEDAELVTSAVNKDYTMHMPVLDLDYSARLEPSTTEGHFHLYLNKEIPFEKLEKLLDCLVDCDLIEKGYAEASKYRGYSAVRRPGVKKPDPVVDPNVCDVDDIPF